MRPFLLSQAAAYRTEGPYSAHRGPADPPWRRARGSQRRLGSGRVALRGPLAALRRLDLAVLRRRRRHELAEQPLGRLGDLVNGPVEGLGVGLRGAGRATHLADVL